jgi:hypothetical protein
MIQFLSRNKFTKIAFVSLVFGMGFFGLAASIYIPIHYAAVMPRSPQPETGRIYRVTAQYGAVVYVNKQEFEWLDFVKFDLWIASAIGMLALFLIGMGLDWFENLRKRE